MPPHRIGSARHPRDGVDEFGVDWSGLLAPSSSTELWRGCLALPMRHAQRHGRTCNITGDYVNMTCNFAGHRETARRLLLCVGVNPTPNPTPNPSPNPTPHQVINDLRCAILPHRQEIKQHGDEGDWLSEANALHKQERTLALPLPITLSLPLPLSPTPTLTTTPCTSRSAP